MLSKLTPASGPRLLPTIELARRLAEHAEAFTGVPAIRVMGKGRPADVALVRQVIMYLLREGCAATWMEAAEPMRRDHGTAMHAHAKISAMLKVERQQGFHPTAVLIRHLCDAVGMRVPAAAAENPSL